MLFEFRVRCELHQAQDLFDYIAGAGEPVLAIDGGVLVDPEPPLEPDAWLPGLGEDEEGYDFGSRSSPE